MRKFYLRDDVSRLKTGEKKHDHRIEGQEAKKVTLWLIAEVCSWLWGCFWCLLLQTQTILGYQTKWAGQRDMPLKDSWKSSINGWHTVQTWSLRLNKCGQHGWQHCLQHRVIQCHVPMVTAENAVGQPTPLPINHPMMRLLWWCLVKADSKKVKEQSIITVKKDVTRTEHERATQFQDRLFKFRWHIFNIRW